MALVDTDVMVDVLRSYGPALDWMRSNSGEPLVLPGFVLLELLEGCRDKSSQERVLKLMESCQVVWLSEVGFRKAVDLFVARRLSHGLDMIDVLIAQTALELGVPLVGFNQKHYGCVLGLEVIAPYSRNA